VLKQAVAASVARRASNLHPSCVEPDRTELVVSPRRPQVEDSPSGSRMYQYAAPPGVATSKTPGGVLTLNRDRPQGEVRVLRREHHFRVEHPRQVTTSKSLSRCLPNEGGFVGQIRRSATRITREYDFERRQDPAIGATPVRRTCRIDPV
jgi:hypothetical protein